MPLLRVFWSDDGEQSDEDSDESEEADLEASLRSKKAPKVPSKRSQATPVPVGRKKRRPHVEVSEIFLTFRMWGLMTLF